MGLEHCTTHLSGALPAALAEAVDDGALLRALLEPLNLNTGGDCVLALIRRWGSLARVLGADPMDIAAVSCPSIAAYLKRIQYAAERVARGGIQHRDVLSSWVGLERYLRTHMGGLRREQLRLLFLDKRNRLIVDEVLGEGTVDHAPVYPREIVRRALQLDASALILAHNHPSGDTSPSSADISMTKEVVTACAAVRITVHDHVLVTGGDVVSMKQLGLI